MRGWIEGGGGGEGLFVYNTLEQWRPESIPLLLLLFFLALAICCYITIIPPPLPRKSQRLISPAPPSRRRITGKDLQSPVILMITVRFGEEITLHKRLQTRFAGVQVRDGEYQLSGNSVLLL